MSHMNAANEGNELTVPENLFDDTDPLEDLLAESTSLLAGTPAKIAAKSQDIFSLEDLLAESMAITAQREQMKSIRKAAANGFGTKEERDANNELLRKWEAAREWNRQANVAVFHRCTCTVCRTYSNVFAGFYERQTHRSNDSIERLVKVGNFSGHYPKEVRYLEDKLPACEDCLRGLGYPVEEDEVAEIAVEVPADDTPATSG